MITWAANSKFYLPTTAHPRFPSGVDWDTTWTSVVTGAVKGRLLSMAGATTGTAMVNLEATVSGHTNSYAFLQFISEYPLDAQTIGATNSGTIAFMSRVSSTAASTYNSVAVHVVNSSGTHQNTLMSSITANNLVNGTSYTPCIRSGFALVDGITTTAGDYLVVELGVDRNSTTGITAGIKYGDDAASDITVDDLSTTVKNGFYTFDEDVFFIENMTNTNQLMMMGAGT